MPPDGSVVMGRTLTGINSLNLTQTLTLNLTLTSPSAAQTRRHKCRYYVSVVFLKSFLRTIGDAAMQKDNKR